MGEMQANSLAAKGWHYDFTFYTTSFLSAREAFNYIVRVGYRDFFNIPI